jgi:hypothetical protein
VIHCERFGIVSPDFSGGTLTLGREAGLKFLFEEFAVGFEEALVAGIELGCNIRVEFQEFLVVSKQSRLPAVKNLRPEGLEFGGDVFLLFRGGIKGITEGIEDFIADGFSGSGGRPKATETESAAKDGEEGGADEERVLEGMGHGFEGLGRSNLGMGINWVLVSWRTSMMARVRVAAPAVARDQLRSRVMRAVGGVSSARAPSWRAAL